VTPNMYEVPKDPKKLITWLDAKREAGKSTASDRQLRTNLAFLLGHQWVAWDDSAGRFRRPAAPSRDDRNAPVRITANKVAGLVERAISKLTKAAPIPEARPVSDSEQDVSTAKVSTRIMDHELYRLDWEAELSSFYFWPTTLGWSYTHLWWDPSAGDSVGKVDVEGETEEGFEGNVVLEQVPAFEMSVDPNAKKFRDARWCVRTTSMTSEAVWERWGKTVSDASSTRSLADDVYSLGNDRMSGRKKDQGSFVNVHQLWLRPGSRASKDGMVVTWAGTTILEGPSPFPYEHGRLPFTQWNLLPGVGTREGRTWVTDLIPLQVDYNDARSREAAIRRMLTPKIVAPTGSIDPRRVTARVEIIDYAPTGQPPHMMIPDSGWMAQYEAGMLRADQEMGDRAGQQDVSNGKAPSASMPAAAILALQEADDTRLALSAKEMASSIRDTGWQLLQLVRQFWNEDRVVRTWSADGDLEVQRFTGADVAKSLDIHVSAESALPRSKAARSQLAMELKNSGMITDPRDFLRLLDMPGTDFLAETWSRDSKQAQRENAELMRGNQVPVNWFDNHEVHWTDHTNEMKEPWYHAAQEDDPRRIAFDAHISAHMEQLAAKQQTLSGAGAPVPQPAGEESIGKGGPAYIDPLTGNLSDPVRAAAGQEPSSLSRGPEGIRKAAGIGATGQQGVVPGVDADTQARLTGN